MGPDNPILKFFEYEHLPLRLQEFSRPIADVAYELNRAAPESAEKSAGLRKLLEAKDCFVRAALALVLFCLLPSAFSLGADAPQFPRGAQRSPAHHLLNSPTHRVLCAPPPQFAFVPEQLDMWGNNQYGDCVTAEECFAKACFSPEIFISSSEAIAWAQAHGYLNGADLVSVMKTMATDGLTAGGQQYDDGSYSSVDYSNETVLQSAISQGPVKIAIDASALPGTAGQQQGWFSLGNGQHFGNTDHCVSICGYGSAEFLFAQLNVPLPSSLAGKSGYLLFTWSTIGFVDHNWLMGTCAEAWLRNPTTVVSPQPTPAPPKPGRLTFAELIQLLIARLHPHLTEAQAAGVADFFSDDDSPRLTLLKEIVYRRGLHAGLIPPGTAIEAVNWQELITILVELEPLIVPLIPLLFGDEQALLADPFSLCTAGAPKGYRTQCGPHGCKLVPIEPKSTVTRPAPPKAATPAVKNPQKHGKKRLFFRSRTK